MRPRGLSRKIGLVLVLAWVLLAVEAGAQAPAPSSPDSAPRAQEPGRGRMRARGPRAGAGERRLEPLFLRLAALPPPEQARVLESDARFQQLPPRMQERFRERLREFNRLPAEERERRLAQGERARHRRASQELILRLAPLAADEQERVLAEDPGFEALPAEAQQRFRQHLERFRSLPPQEREKIVRHLERFRALAPEGQEKVRRRAALFGQMSPEHRQEARRAFRAWRELPPERQQLLRERLERMEAAPESERPRLAVDPAFLAPLEPAEQELLRELGRLRKAVASLPSSPPSP